MNPDLSIVIPTYNERDNIEEIVRATVDVLGHRRFEVIVVDDNSPDRTWEIVERLAAVMPYIRLLRRTESPRDQAHAIVEGFRMSRGVILGKMDADGSHDPRAITRLVDAIEAGFDVAVGSRYSTGSTICSWPLQRRLLSKVSTAVVRVVMRLELEDPLSGFWMLRREVFERAAKFPVSGGFKVLLQLCVRGRARSITEVPIHFRDRTRGGTKLRPRLFVQGLAMVISLAIENRHHSARRTVRHG